MQKTRPDPVTLPKVADQKYDETVLRSLAEVDAIVPDLWHLEASDVLLGAEKRTDWR